MATYAAAQMAVDKEAVGLWRVHVRERERERERERDNFIEMMIHVQIQITMKDYVD